MTKLLPALLLAALTSGTAAALSVGGTVTGNVPAGARVGGFVVDSGGTPFAELVSVPVAGGRFTLEIPSVTPPVRGVSPLRPDAIFWPGVLEPVNVSGQVNTADLRFYIYADGNGNGRRDDSEALQEAVPFAGKAALVVAYASGDASITAARGFTAALKSGWNGLLIEVGKVVKVTQSSAITGVNLNVER
ncbi:hypothetical protein MF271_05795 [Deinococcus sp. KNUC1210]|uniref:hypothetical protein n=1 Tax=Deinococcus sp. KNUC1210 TaxID=2917691 RepID=UPI001EF0C519|nr:hypothetical protein [Deinococcus sp. KNUC1210]ULH16132.1 hypothetical protein MF271_05795 [Deinococcus sp. KNUC1210]